MACHPLLSKLSVSLLWWTALRLFSSIFFLVKLFTELITHFLCAADLQKMSASILWFLATCFLSFFSTCHSPLSAKNPACHAPPTTPVSASHLLFNLLLYLCTLNLEGNKGWLFSYRKVKCFEFESPVYIVSHYPHCIWMRHFLHWL